MALPGGVAVNQAAVGTREYKRGPGTAGTASRREAAGSGSRVVVIVVEEAELSREPPDHRATPQGTTAAVSRAHLLHTDAASHAVDRERQGYY